jgi:hypothetical protein
MPCGQACVAFVLVLQASMARRSSFWRWLGDILDGLDPLVQAA